jgi:hypothetical protein
MFSVKRVFFSFFFAESLCLACIISCFFCWCSLTHPCCSLLVFFGCPCYVLLAHLCFALLVFVGISWLWSIVVHQLLLVVFYWCLLAPPSYVLLLFVSFSWVCFVGAYWRSLVLPGCVLLLFIGSFWLRFVDACWHLLIMCVIARWLLLVVF